MKSVSYTFTVIRYVHDRAAGEALNIGVVVVAPEIPFMAVRVEQRFERLSRAFAGFDGEVYRQTVARFSESINQLKPKANELPNLRELPRDAPELIRLIWPDLDLSFTTGPLLAGITTQPLDELADSLFARMVSSQAPGRGEGERRSDEEVWAKYQGPLRRVNVSHHLAPKIFAGPDFQIKFEHAFQNTKWRAVQPVTMDFVRAESLQEKATKWLGNASALEGHPQLGMLYILLGEPRTESHRTAYVKAKNLLNKMKVRHEIVEEREAEAFANELASYMREHGILTEDEG